MSDLLHALHTLHENILDLSNNINRVVVENWNELVGLSDQIKLEKRLWILVPGKLLVDLLLDLFGPGKLILINWQVAIRLVFV